MIWPRIRRQLRGTDTISTLYGMIVAQARLPCFYRDYAVADTVNGSFELIVLHLTLALDRLFAEPTLRGLGQRLFDVFCQDMDDNLREMGVGDLSVPKELRHIGDAFYGRSQAYTAALKSSEEQSLAEGLTDVIARNVYGGCAAKDGAPRRLAGYMRRAHHELKARDAGAVGRGEFKFPDPAGFLMNAD
jgi:cytochrome b pre-mRNA-processing protein 3